MRSRHICPCALKGLKRVFFALPYKVPNPKTGPGDGIIFRKGLRIFFSHQPARSLKTEGSPFPENKIVTEVCLVSHPLEFCLWFTAFVVSCLRVESAIETDMKISFAERACGFSRKVLIDLYLFLA